MFYKLVFVFDCWLVFCFMYYLGDWTRPVHTYLAHGVYFLDIFHCVVYYAFLKQYSIEGRLHCFQSVVIINNTEINIFGLLDDICKTSRNRIAKSKDICILNLYRWCPDFFQRDFLTNLFNVSELPSPHPSIFVNLVGETLYSIVVYTFIKNFLGIFSYVKSLFFL